MLSLFFWRVWLKEYRAIWYILSAIFLCAMIYLWFAYFRGNDNIIQWETLQEQKVIESTVHSYRLGPFELNVPAESYVIFEYFSGSDLQPNVTASYIFLFVLVAGAIVMLTVFTTLEKFWYYVAMALFIAFFISLRLEVLGLFGEFNRTPAIAILIAYLLPAFYFNKFAAATSFTLRLIVFSALTIITCVLITQYAHVEYPFYHLSVTGYMPALILCVLFIIIVAHDIMASLVNVISQGSSKSLRHMLIIGVIYLANLMITALYEVGTIQWDFIYINLYLLLTISAIVGVWGFRQREVLYGNIMRFYPFGGFFFLALGSICFITIGHHVANANDATLKILRDAIIFSHTGFTLIFLAYVFSNFAALLAENQSINKILYQPVRMPYFTFRFAGVIVMLAFAFYSNWREYVYHGWAGFYNYAGDMHRLLGNEKTAYAFYDQARKQGFQNHRSNYALGIRNTSPYSLNAAHYNYSLANGKRPSEYSLVNAGNLFILDNDLFNAIRSYKKSLSIQPSSGPVANNLGVAYAKIHNLDSAVHFFNEARSHNRSRHSAEANFFAMVANDLIPVKADSLLKTFDSKSTSTISNALAVSTLFRQPFNHEVNPLAEKKLNLYSATLLNNYIIRNAKTLDTTFTNTAHTIASDSLNEDFSEALKAALAFAYYHQGNVTKALSIIGELAYISQSYQGEFNYLMGLWALEQSNPELAISSFAFAENQEYKRAKFYHAIALTESRQTGKAITAWDSIAHGQDENEKIVAQSINRVLTMLPEGALAAKDHDKYQFCRYRLGLKDSIFFNRILNTFNNPNYKAQAMLDMSKRYYEADMVEPAIRYFRRIAGLQLTDNELYERCRHFELNMLAYRGEVHPLVTQINRGIEFNEGHKLEKILYTALVNEASGQDVSGSYEILATYNPYFEEGIIAAANFFRKLDDKSMKPYDILASALQINTNSIRLLKAYILEAQRMGFDEYAASAKQTLRETEANLF